ncbi:MAG: hypothetical protein K2Q03_05200 [Sphingobacteriaceae bacterium]|nr:hypothetical protein [Sphingobacteriaceae bacterium]
MKNLFRKSIVLFSFFVLSFASKAQVKIGDNPTVVTLGAILDLESTDQGLLIPRVSLTDTSTWGLQGSSVAGMIVYNTNSAMTGTIIVDPVSKDAKGLFYWNGLNWVQVGSSALLELVIIKV